MFENREICNCCFMCKHFYHANPDDDKCDIDDKIVFIDTPKCERFE